MSSVVTYIRFGSCCTIEDLLRIKEEAFGGVPNSKIRIDPAEMVSSDLILVRLCDKDGCARVADRPSTDGRVLCGYEHS